MNVILFKCTSFDVFFFNVCFTSFEYDNISKKKKKSLEITFEILAENFFYPQRCLSNLIIFDHINFIYAKNHDKVRI